MFKNILLAVDGSELASRAAKIAGELARTSGASLRVVVAFEPVPAYLGEPNLGQAIAARATESDALLETALKEIGDIPAESLHTEALEGSPADVILNVAETRENDLIIMGSHGRGRLTEFLLGSQSQKVLNHARCPVLIVH